MVAVAGCTGDARVELTAAQSLEALAGELDQALGEYHDTVTVGDDDREASIVSAYLARVRRDTDDPAALAQNERDLVAALEKLKQARAVESARWTATADNVSLLRETATELRRSAVKSAAVSTDARRYVESVVNQITDANASPDPATPRRPARRTAIRRSPR